MYHWYELAQRSENDLGGIDIAEVNFACAAGLPGTEGMDIPFCLQRIDDLEQYVKDETARKWYLFENRPEQYGNSEAFFRVLIMILTLQQDCGIRFNPAKIPLDVPFYPEDTFLFGIFQGDGGTCASLPVLYTSI